MEEGVNNITSSQAKEPVSQTLDLLQGLKSGQLDPKSISIDDRRLLVAFLVGEGQSTAEIAHLMKTSDRTIERDRKALRESHALAKDPELTAQMAGRLLREAELSIQRIRKYERDPDATAAIKIDAEHRCFQIASLLTEKLQSMGFVETVSQRVESTVDCRVGPIQSLEELAQETQRLQEIEESIQTGGEG